MNKQSNKQNRGEGGTLKGAAMKTDHLNCLSLPWRLCRNLEVEKSVLGRGMRSVMLEKT